MRPFCLILLCALAACQSGPAPERHSAAPLPARVVLFAPSMTEAACALGYEDRIVAITDYDRWPPSVLDRPRIGGALDPDFEQLAVLQPDLLILQGESEELHRFAADRQLRVADVKMDDELGSILDGLLKLDTLLGGEESRRGEELVERIQAGLDSIARTRPEGRPRVLLVLSRTPHKLGGLFSAGSGTFLEDLLDVVGAENWAATVGPGYFEVPLDVIAADAPDLVLEFGPGIEGDPKERARVWSALPGDAPPLGVVEFDGLMIPGPRLVESASALAAAIDRVRAP